MQKFVRSTFASVLSATALVALAACGDKVEVVQPITPVPGIIGITVNGPTVYQLTTVTNDSLTFAANVNAEAGFTGNRAVTWTSSDPTVFRISSASGAGKALKAGSTVITATSAQTASIVGSLSLTVTAGPLVVPVTPATVVITRIAQGANGPPGVPIGANVDLGNVAGQIDIAVDVSYTAANRPATVTLDLIGPAPATTVTTCDSRPFGGSSASEASTDVSTVTLSCLTARFDTTTGATTFKNGAYTLRASLTGGAAPSTTPAVTSLTLNNADFIRATFLGTTVSGGRTVNAATTNGVRWNGGTVNAKVLPVLYTAGRSVTTAAVSLVNGGSDAGFGFLAVGAPGRTNGPGAPADIACGTAYATVTGAVPAGGSVSFSGADSTTLAGVENVMVDTTVVAVAATDQAGNAVNLVRNADLTPSTAGCFGGGGAAPSATLATNNFLRLDNRDPLPSQFDPRFVPTQGANDEFALNGQNSAWLGSGVTLPATGSTNGVAASTNGVLVGVDQGSNSNTLTYQFAPAGTARTGTWTSVTSPSTIPQSSDPFTYNIRLITRDAIGNADTTRISLAYNSAGGTVVTVIPESTVGFAPATFGVDITAPTGAIATGTNNPSSIISAIACAANQYPGLANRPFACAAPAIVTNPMTFSMTDPLGANGATGSQFGATPINVAIRQLAPSPTSNSASVTNCYNPNTAVFTAATTADPNCTTTVTSSTSLTLPAAEGVYTVTWSVSDEANNRSPVSTFNYVIDNTVAVVAVNPVSIPTTITGGTTFATQGSTFGDNLDILGANAFLFYPDAGNVMIATAATATAVGTAFDATLTRLADASVVIATPFYRTIWARNGGCQPAAAGPTCVVATPNTFFNAAGTSGKPSTLGIRAWDGVRNLSTPVIVTLPPTNIGGGTNPYIVGGANAVDYTDFQLWANSGTRDNSGGNNDNSSTLTAVVIAPATSLQTPFAQVCFYYSVSANLGPAWNPTAATTSGAGGTNGTTFGSSTAAPAPAATNGAPPAGFYPAAGANTTGDLTLVGCQATATTTGGGAAGIRNYTYQPASTFNPPNTFSNGAGTRLTFWAIGVNAAGDAVMSNPFVVTLN